MSVIVITGVGGMIGSSLAHWILNNTEHEIIGIDNMSGGFIENMPERSDRFRFCRFDVNDAGLLNNVFERFKPEVCYHFAAYAAENLSPFIRRFNYKNNVVGTATIVNTCINNDTKRLVFSSSIAVYGHEAPPFSENDIPNPQDPYANAKYCSEIDIKIAGKQHGLDWCIVRPYNVYGKRQNIFDKYRNVAGIFIWQLLNNKPMTIFGDGNQLRSFTCINDIAEPLYLAGTSNESSKQIINLGSNKSYSVLQVAQMLKEISGNGNIEYLEKRFESESTFCDNTKAKKVLNYKDQTTLHDGLSEMYNWAKTLKMKPQSEWEKFEINKGMYKAWEK